MEKQSLSIPDKQKLQTLKGFRDFLPKEAKKRQLFISKLIKYFTLFGFEPIETPALEYQELLLGKYGEDADQLIYTFKDKGKRNVALRYDQTVPTARVLATHREDLPMPFRRYQIQPVWRAEKPQSGRYREFLQCDADIFASSSPISDAEILALTNHVYKNLGFDNYKIYVNDRNILFELMDFSSIPKDQHLPVIAAIDKLDRKSLDEVKTILQTTGLNDKTIDHLFNHIETAKPTENLEKVIAYAEKMGVDNKKLVFQARLARGLDYYTKTIFEVKIDEYKTGSVAGGGRYDHLIEKLSGISIPAVGISFGVDRTIEAMDALDLFSKDYKKSGCLVSIFNDKLIPNSIKVTELLRNKGIEAELYPDEAKDLKKQLKYADKKGVLWFVVIGTDEAKKNSCILKNLDSGHQEDVKLNRLAETIKQLEN